MDFPSKCPYCGKDNVPNSSGSLRENLRNLGYRIELHKCIHCNKPIIVVYDELENDERLVHQFPYSQLISFPKRVKDLSPNAYTAYTQTIKAKEQGFDMLVGAGLRIALEWLVWDYLIKIKNYPESEIDKLSLAKRIEKMNGDFYTKVCTRLVRLFGNDSVHIIKQLDFSTDEVIEIFEMLCSIIDSELQVKEVNDRLPK